MNFPHPIETSTVSSTCNKMKKHLRSAVTRWNKSSIAIRSSRSKIYSRIGNREKRDTCCRKGTNEATTSFASFHDLCLSLSLSVSLALSLSLVGSFSSIEATIERRTYGNGRFDRIASVERFPCREAGNYLVFREVASLMDYRAWRARRRTLSNDIERVQRRTIASKSLHCRDGQF